MLTPISVISIMMMSLGVVGILLLIYFAITRQNGLIALWVIIAGLVLVFTGALMYVENVPTKADVLSGKAQYIQELNVIKKNNGTTDTITTYSLQFKPRVYKTVEQ